MLFARLRTGRRTADRGAPANGPESRRPCPLTSLRPVRSARIGYHRRSTLEERRDSVARRWHPMATAWPGSTSLAASRRCPAVAAYPRNKKLTPLPTQRRQEEIRHSARPSGATAEPSWVFVARIQFAFLHPRWVV